MSRFGLLRAIEARLRPSDASANYIAFKVAAGITSPYSITYPTALPASQNALTVDATGLVSWAAIGGGGGTVTALSASSLFNVATPSTTPALSFVSQAANLFLASPNGASGVPLARSIVSADIPKTLDSSWVTNFDTQVRTSRLDQLALPTAVVNFNSQRITGLLDPVSPQDAVTKSYADAVSQGLDIKASVRVASTANVTISAPGTAIDGVTLAALDRVLLKNQTTASENGFWVFNGSAAAMTRSTDADTSAKLTSGAFAFVESGAVNSSTSWVVNTTGTITPGTTPITFTQFGSAAAIIDGNGLVKTGNTFDVVGTAGRIASFANNIDIDSTYAGQASIITLGTISTGSWNAAPIPITSGGTGATTAATARTALGISGNFRGTFTSSSGVAGITVASNVVTITHNLGQKVVDIVVSDPNNKRVFPDDTTYTSTNVATLDFSIMGIAAGTWELYVSG